MTITTDRTAWTEPNGIDEAVAEVQSVTHEPAHPADPTQLSNIDGAHS